MVTERVNEIIRQVRFEAETRESGDIVRDLYSVMLEISLEIGKIMLRSNEEKGAKENNNERAEQ